MVLARSIVNMKTENGKKYIGRGDRTGPQKIRK